MAEKKEKKTANEKPKGGRTPKKPQPPNKASVEIGGNVSDANIIIGGRNQVTNQKIINPITNIFQAVSPRTYILSTALFLIALLAAGYLFWYANLRYQRVVASGQLNVLVVPFVEEKSWGYANTDLGWNIAQILANGTRNAFSDSGNALDIQILGPTEKVPKIHVFTEGQLNREVEKLSGKTNAQIVIYGVVTEDDYGDKVVSTKVYISPTNFGEAQELISDSMMGELEIGSFRLTGDTASGADLLSQNKELRDRLEIFSAVINFLGAYIGEDFDLADEQITMAEDQNLWSNTDGLEVIYLIHGNMEIRRTRTLLVEKDLDAALANIAKAKDLFVLSNETSIQNGQGSYSRAYLGLAGAESLSAIAEFNVTGDRELIDVEALDKVLAYLEAAQTADYQPETADIDVKVFYNMAQTHLAYFVKTNDNAYLDKAKENYQQIVDEYLRSRNVRITEYAALSYSGLGHIAFQNGEFENSAESFMQAQKLTSNPSLKAQLLARVGDAYYSMADYENALKYYQEALGRRSDLAKAVSETRVLQLEERVRELSDYFEGEEK